MITIITALYPEAKGLIIKLKLKQNPSETLYQLFEGDNLRLMITGAGMISAATAVARHFAHYPANTGHDLVINLGVAGYVPAEHSLSKVQIGDLFLISKLTEQMTARTFYPDLLYRYSFRLLPLITVPVVYRDASLFSEDSLVDMEASALYQALLPHISPDRMLFFKVVSDIPGQASPQPVRPEELLTPHLDNLCSYLTQLHTFLESLPSPEVTYTSEETTLIKRTKQVLPMTETMTRDFERLLLYAKRSNLPLCRLLSDFLSSIKNITIRGKKQAMPYLTGLRELIVNTVPEQKEPKNNLLPSDCKSNMNFYQPFFATVYAEKEVWNDYWQEQFRTTPIFINHYKDIFNRSHQNFAAQKKAPALILAKKTGTLIYKGAPVCQSFGNEHFYYTSCMMNCIYHCDYCYLQGMYPSGHVVVFVNL